MRRVSFLRPALAAAVAALLLVPPAAPASALTDSWADWGPIEGSSNRYTTTMTPTSAGFPEATVASDSRGNVQVAGGSSAVLGPATPPGEKYGTSAGSPYLVLRPKADTPTTPSTTTYTFDAPTPDTGWAFVLGDVDADQVRVTATDADGSPIPPAVIDTWFAGSFNYAGGADLPTWDAGTATLVGNPGALDTDGASGWFEPTTPLTSLTLTFTRRAGFPVYQTWFVSRARPITGTLTDVGTLPGCAVEDAEVTLLSPSGEVLATATPTPEGAFDLGEHATQAGYVVRLTAAPGCAVVGRAEVPVDNRGDDGSDGSIAELQVRAIVPQPISGTVRDGDEQPVAGVVVTLQRPDGTTAETTTAADGTYLFDANDADDAPYTVSIGVPAGYAAGDDGTELDVVVDDVPLTEQDFVVTALPVVSGTVTGGGAGLGGVRVVLTPEGGGDPLVAVTRGDGSYEIPGVPPGDHTIAVEPPEGFAGGAARPLTVEDADVPDVDVALVRPGALGGSVVDADGDPVAGVEVVVTGPDGAVVATDDAGGFFLDGLAAGAYTVTVTPPDGAEVDGDATLAVEVTEAGEVIGGLDFVLVAAEEPEPTTEPTTGPTDGPTTDDPSPSASPTGGEPSPSATGGGGSGTLPDTGADVAPALGVALALALAGAALWLRARRRAVSGS